MKKFVKPLVIAASVAAVAGIGAVSFAAWQGTSAPIDKTSTANIGSVATIDTDMAITTNLSGKTLMPADQATITGDEIRIVTIEITTEAASTLYDITHVYKLYVTSTATNAKFYYSLAYDLDSNNANDTSTIVPGAGDSDNEEAIPTGFTLISTNASSPTPITFSGDKKIYICMTSPNATKANDMGKDVTIHLLDDFTSELKS